jgi:dipeptidyl aminopeptidase/acylaminoacyl peptidase
MGLNLLKESNLLNSIAAKYLIRLIGLKRITKKFWYRWIASGAEYNDIVETIPKIKDFSYWCQQWSIVAEKYSNLAKQAEAEGSKLSQQRYYFKSSIYYYLGQWAVFENNEEKRSAYKRSKTAFLKASLTLDVPHKEVTFSHKQCELNGYLRIPKTDDKLPCVIFVHGMDSAKEEVYWTEKEALDRGLATFMFDGPGQGETLILHNLCWEEDFEEVIISAIDYVKSVPQIDANNLFLVGLSWGGFWVLKTSALLKDIRGCVSIGGPPSSDHFHKIPLPLRVRFQKLFNVEGDQEKMNRIIKKMKLGELVYEISCPTFIVHGKKDVLVPYQLVCEMVEKLKGDVTFKTYDDGDHCCTQYASELRNMAADWVLSKISST